MFLAVYGAFLDLSTNREVLVSDPKASVDVVAEIKMSRILLGGICLSWMWQVRNETVDGRIPIRRLF